MTTHIFLELIQVAIGQRRCLSKVLTVEEWGQMHGLLKKHALLGIGFVAIQKLPREQWPPVNIVLALTAYATQIKAKNAELNDECLEVVRQIVHDGIGAVVIKGQSNWENYPEELREYRNPGDIDIWTMPMHDCGIPIAVQSGDSVEYEYYKCVREIIEYARLQRRLREDKSQFKPLYYHVEYHTDKGTEVEMHYRPSFFCSPLRNWRMQRLFKEQYGVCLKNKGLLGFPVLTPSVNVIYTLVHLYRHVFEGGVGLRQLMDYYFTLKAWSDNYELQIRNCDLSAQTNEKLLNDELSQSGVRSSQGMWAEGFGVHIMSKEEVIRVLCSFGMGKFAAAVMWVLHEVFAMPAHYNICKPNKKEGHKLLAEIMQGGNFGHYDERGKNMKNGGTIPHAIWKLKRVMRLASSYPEEALCEPFFRVWHWGWRLFH